MSIDFSSIWHIIGLLGAIGSFIFYGARAFGKTVEQIERLSQAIDTLQQNLESQNKACKEGRIELWTEVNRMRERMTAVETIQKMEKRKDL